MKISKSCLLVVLSSLSLQVGVAAQFVPDFQESINLLTNASEATGSEEAGQAAQTGQKVLDGKSMVDDMRMIPGWADGATVKYPKSAGHRPGHETPPEKYETVGVNGKKIRKRYLDFIAGGCSIEVSTVACNYIVALIIGKRRLTPTPA